MTYVTRQSEKQALLDIHKLAVILIMIMLIYENYNTEPETVKVSIENPKFSLLRPEKTKFAINSNTDNPQVLIHLNNFKYIINSEKCGNNSEGLLLLIIVSSNPNHIENRDVIRKTWGNTLDTTKIVFLLGNTINKSLNKEIIMESNLHGDIVQGNFDDSYRNMSFKHVMGLKWASAHCNSAKYILKTDDDILVNTDKLRRFLLRDLSPWGAEKLILCRNLIKSPIIRNRSKWKVMDKEIKGEFYPSYCSGFAILYSRDVIHQLLQWSYEVPYFWIDDVYVTGLLRKKTNISITGLKFLYNRGRTIWHIVLQKPAIFSEINLKPKDMLLLWKQIID